MSDDRKKKWAEVEKQRKGIRESVRPSVLFRPALIRNKAGWCVKYGGSKGCSAMGDTPDAAMRNFDHAWFNAVVAQDDKVLGGAPEIDPGVNQKKNADGELETALEAETLDDPRIADAVEDGGDIIPLA